MEKTIFGKYLAEKGLKMTRERAAVLEEVFAFHGHFDPERLLFRIRESGVKASRASVYRTLNLLLETGLVEKVTRTDKGTLYEHTYGHDHHDHMICTDCGTIIEFYSEKIEKLQREICHRNNFEGESHTLEIRGRCEKCGKNGNK